MAPADRTGGNLGGVVAARDRDRLALALGTALLFYFGWRRSEAQAEALGFDVSVLGVSPQDFMLRSIPVLFFPVALVLVASLGAVLVHARLMGRVRAEPGQRWRPWHRPRPPVVLGGPAGPRGRPAS